MENLNHKTTRDRRRISWQHAAGLGILLCSSSCSSASKYVKNAFAPDPAAAMAKADAAEKQDRVQTAQANTKPGQKAANSQNSAEHAVAQAAPGHKKLPASPAIAEKPVAKTGEKPANDVMNMIARGEDPFIGTSPSGITQASAEVPAAPDKSSAAPIRHEAETRVPLSNQAATTTIIENCPPVGMAGSYPPNSTVPNGPMPDEYVRDGGDKGLPVHYEAGNRAGFEVEDTIAEYQTEDGKFHVKPSTEAKIYAPRFGEVRSATLSQEELTVEKAQGHQDQLAASRMDAKMVISEKVQADEPQGMQARSRASGLKVNETDSQLDKAIGAKNQTKLVNAFEDYRFIQEGQFDRVSSASLNLGITAAQEWADGRRPVIVAQDRSGQILQSRASAREYVGVEDRRTPAELKLIKVADKSFAHPGDIVTFTIRFDNTGGKDLLQVRVVDNLSPRLVYVQDSIESNLDGGVEVTDNGQGGEMLTFNFDQPLKGKTGGYVTFKCRVR